MLRTTRSSCKAQRDDARPPPPPPPLPLLRFPPLPQRI